MMYSSSQTMLKGYILLPIKYITRLRLEEAIATIVLVVSAELILLLLLVH